MQIQTEKRIPLNDNPFDTFIILISLDQEIRTIYQQIEQLKHESEVLVSQKQELTGRLQQFNNHTLDLRKQVDAYELEIKALDMKERAKKDQLDTVKNIHEYQPLKKEVENLKQEQHHIENRLMTVWNKLDIAQKELQEQQSHYTAKLEELDTLLQKKAEQTTTLNAQLVTKKKMRPQKEDGVPQEWLEKYLHMRLQVDDPVVPVMRGGCSACFYTITDQELLRLKRRALVQCKGCFRLLFMQEAMKENNPST